MNWFFKSKPGKIARHTLVWLAVIALPFILREILSGGPEAPRVLTRSFSGAEIRLYFLLFALLIGFFYLNTEILIPRLFLKKRFGWYAASILICWVAIAAVMKATVFSGLLGEAGYFRERRFYGMNAALLITWLSGLGYRLTVAWFRTEQSRLELEHEKLKTELSFLQGQINPHFLFNTLNTIYTLASRKSDQTAGSVLQLSNLLRYVLDAHAETAPLDEEIRHLEDFIGLHRLRLTAKTRVEFGLEGEPAGKQIAPMLLLPFVENAFKYGVSSHHESRIVFRIKVTGTDLHFYAQNNRFNTEITGISRQGIGIQNVQRRLDLLYPERHQLNIAVTEKMYTVDLNIEFENRTT